MEYSCKTRFKKVDYHNNTISIIDGDEHVNFKVARIGNLQRECYFLVEPIMGSVFGGCSCGGGATSKKINFFSSYDCGCEML